MKPSTIVVIEDNADFATILGTVLGLWGYAVNQYDTLKAGTAALAQSSPAMLILDGQLPDGDGYSLYQRLRRQPTTAKLPILLLSVSDDVYQQAHIASSHDRYLHVGLKPMPLDDIQTVVTRFIGM